METFTSHGRCLQALADSGRMVSVQWFDDAYCVMASGDWDVQKYVQQMGRANWRFVLFASQAVLVPNLQVTFYGVQKHLLKTSDDMGMDIFTTMSVWISMVSAFKYLLWELKIIWCSRQRLLEAVRREREKLERGDTQGRM